MQQSIVKTLIYFDIHDYPLTLMEIWKWLYADNTDRSRIDADGSRLLRRSGGFGGQARMAHSPRFAVEACGSITDILEAVDQMSDKIESKDGFYFLKNRQELVQLRLERYNIAEQKFKRARKFVKLISLIPFVRCVIVVNRLAYGNVHPESDIDLAVIVKKNRLWLTRLMSIGLLNFLKVRPRQIDRSKAIDLSFFISEDGLNLESLKFEDDVLFPFWVSQFVPVYDDGVFKQFIEANQWVKNYLPNSFEYQLNDCRQVGQARYVRRLISLLGDWNFIERMSKKYQIKIMPSDLKAMMNKDSRVTVNDQVLKFHRHDNRQEVQEEFNRAFKYLNI